MSDKKNTLIRCSVKFAVLLFLALLNLLLVNFLL